jgi:dienelactone hydrolase
MATPSRNAVAVRAPFLLVATVLSLAAPPARGSEAVEALLLQAATPAELRAKLEAYASSAPDTARAGKGAALYYAGLSFDRAGRPDSALFYYERAITVRGERTEGDAYLDALLQRGKDGDAARVLKALDARSEELDIGFNKARRAWALYGLGRGDSALSQMRSVSRWLLDRRTPYHREWRYRLGLLELEHGDPARCIDLLLQLAIASRFKDRDVMSILREAARRTSQASQMADVLQRELAVRDGEDREALKKHGASRLTFPSPLDGFEVGGVAFTPAAPTGARAVVAVMDPEETFESYDSLAIGLARAGYAVLLIEPRGSGRSVATTCPLPDTWRGRQEEMHHRVASDVAPGLRALAAATPIDTTSYLVIGSQASASIAVEAAALDARARPIVILSPYPSPVDRGSMRARLKALGAPVFFEIPGADRATFPLAEALYDATDRRASRIAESEWPGEAATVFRRDLTALPRLLRWIDESWPATSSRTKRPPSRSRP